MSKITELNKAGGVSGREEGAFVSNHETKRLNINQIKEHIKQIIYYQGEGESSTSARLIGGVNAETDLAAWKAIDDGEFTIEFDGGGPVDIMDLDFSNIDNVFDSMHDVAAVIDTGLRAATETDVVCIWTGTRFNICSSITGAESVITVTGGVSGGEGTDISVPEWTDTDVTNAIVWPAIIGGGNMMPVQSLWALLEAQIGSFGDLPEVCSSNVLTTAIKEVWNDLNPKITENDAGILALQVATDRQILTNVSISATNSPYIVPTDISLVYIDTTDGEVELDFGSIEDVSGRKLMLYGRAGGNEVKLPESLILPTGYQTVDMGKTGIFTMDLLYDGDEYWQVTSYIS
jgi:hypothetical protein